MLVDRKFLVLVIAIGALGAGWLLRDNAEAEVRQAHAELARLLNKFEGDATNPRLMSARVLQGLFAETCSVTSRMEKADGERLFSAFEFEAVAMPQEDRELRLE